MLYLNKENGGNSMSEWKKSVENCFFTNHLDKQLKEFLNSQKALSSDAERWEFIHKSAYEWERECSANFDEMIMPSFFGQWHISARWGEFSLPAPNPHTLEETLYWIFLTGWVLISGYDKVYVKEKRVPFMPLIGLDWLFQRKFQYSQEACTWLDKQHFLAEIENIYNCAQEVLLDCQKRPDPINPRWICDAESGCSKFFKYYTFCKDSLKNPEIVRLNKFDPDEYVWYLIREESTLYFLQLSDFG